MPGYVAPNEVADTALAERFPLAMISPPARNYLNSTFVNVQSLRDAEGEPHLDIHPHDAAARGIADGARVRVFNDRGSLELKARVTERARPGVVVALSVWWKKLARDGKNANELTSQALTDIGRAPTFYDCRVELEPAPHSHADVSSAIIRSRLLLNLRRALEAERPPPRRDRLLRDPTSSWGMGETAMTCDVADGEAAEGHASVHAIRRVDGAEAQAARTPKCLHASAVTRPRHERALQDIWTQRTQDAIAEQGEYRLEDYSAQLDGLSYEEVVRVLDPTGAQAKRYRAEYYYSQTPPAGPRLGYHGNGLSVDPPGYQISVL